MPGLVLRNISKAFDSTVVLDDISLELAEGELLVLLGPSGCGKSTLLRIIAGLEEADRGEVHIDGRRVDQLRPRDRNVALVFQNYSLYPHMTVAKNLAFPLKVSGAKKAEIESKVREVSEMLGLGDRLADRPGQLSGGQRQRVALGRAIIREPSIFLLDEPLSNLDADLRVRMRREIVGIQNRLGKTMVHVTHDQAEALTMADRIALLNEGRVVQLATPEKLYRYPADVFAAAFVGMPRINLVKGRLMDNRLVPFGIIPPRELSALRGDNKSLTIGVRPESIELTGTGDYTAEVLSSEYLGDHYVAALDFQGHRLTVSKLTGEAPSPGQTVRFGIDKDSLLYFDSATGENLIGIPA